MPFAHEVSWPSRPRRFFFLPVMRRVFAPLLALLLLVPGVIGFIPGEAILRRVMTQELERQTEALVAFLKAETDRKIQRIADDSRFPQLAEINKLRDEYNRLANERNLLIQQKNEAINDAARKLARRLEAYGNLLADYEKRRADVEASRPDVTQKIDALESQAKKLQDGVIAAANELIDLLNQGTELSNALQVLRDSIEKGTHPSVQEIDAIVAQLEGAIGDINEELTSRQDAFNAQVNAYNGWLSDAQIDLENLVAVANARTDDYNDFVPAYNAKVEEEESLRTQVNRLVNDYNAALARGDDATASQLLAEYNALLPRFQRVEKELQEAGDYLDNLKREADVAMQAYKAEKTRVEGEAAQKKEVVERERAAFETFRKEKESEVQALDTEAGKRIDAINAALRLDVDKGLKELEDLKAVLGKEYGPEYEAFLDLLSTYAKEGKVDETIAALSNLLATGGPRLKLTYVDLLSVQGVLRSADALVADFNAKVKAVEELTAKVTAEGEKLAEDEVTLDRLRKELEEYKRTSKASLDAKGKEIRAKEKDLAALDARVEKLLALFDAQSSLVNRQALLVAELLSLEPRDVEDLKNRYDDAVDTVKAQDGKPADILDRVAGRVTAGDGQPGANSTKLEVSTYVDQGIRGSQVLKEDEKKSLISRWYALLRDEDALSDAAEGLKSFLARSEGGIWDFLYSLFVNGFFVDSTFERVTFDNGTLGYRVTVEGETYWINEKGGLEQTQAGSFIFAPYKFKTPASTPEGEKLRSIRSALRKDFEEKFASLPTYQKGVVALVDALIREADRLEDQNAKAQLIESAQNMARFAAGTAPIAGDLLDLSEAVTGYDVFGKPLTGRDRMFSALGMLVANRQVWSGAADFLVTASRDVARYSSEVRAFSKAEGRMLEGLSADLHEVGARTKKSAKQRIDVANYELKSPCLRAPSLTEAGPCDLSKVIDAANEAKIIVRGNSKLAKALEAAGEKRLPGEEAHHIVAQKAINAKNTRNILDRHSIDIHGVENGVWLPGNKNVANTRGKSVHRSLHTTAYYRKIEERIVDANEQGGKAGVLRELAAIKKDFLKGTLR